MQECKFIWISEFLTHTNIKIYLFHSCLSFSPTVTEFKSFFSEIHPQLTFSRLSTFISTLLQSAHLFTYIYICAFHSIDFSTLSFIMFGIPFMRFGLMLDNFELAKVHREWKKQHITSYHTAPHHHHHHLTR